MSLKPQIYNSNQPLYFNGKEYPVPKGHEIIISYESGNHFVAKIDDSDSCPIALNTDCFAYTENEIKEMADYIAYCFIGFIQSGLSKKYYPKIELEKI